MRRIDAGTALRRLRYTVASAGLVRTAADVMTLLATYRPERDASFDRRFGTDTAGCLPTTELDIADGPARDAAVLYLPSPARVTRWAIQTLPLDHRTHSFVDLGCGKGRVLLVASEFPFQRIVGVEVSPRLAGIARENVRRYTPKTRKCWAVDVHQVEAARFSFPATDLLIHFYHPFEPPMLREVLLQLERSLATQPRRVTIAYLLYSAAIGPVAEVFGQFPWLRQSGHEQSLLGQYDWLFYSN
jgi:SAM-dependent methyltransferase